MGSAAAAAGAAGGRVRAGTRSVSPNEKLNVAGVGIGGKGRSDVAAFAEENVVALCEVDAMRGKQSFEAFPKAAQYKDYRVMLEKEKDLDVVIVSTPDHMHAPIAMAAIQLGKHVYVQKPLTHSVFEARKLAEAAREAGVASQMGNQGQAGDEVRTLCEYIWDGAIGAVREVHVWTDRPLGWWPQGIRRPVEEQRVPSALDWDLWLGVAPERAFNRAYHPFKWRGWWDFGTGALGDIGCHAMAPIFRALKLGHPTSVEANSSEVFKDTYPLASIVRYQFPARGDMPPLKLTWYDGGLKPARPEELDTPLDVNGALYIGDKGKMLGKHLLPASKMRDYTAPARTLPRSIGHYEEFIAACKGGEAGGSDFSIAGPLTEVVLLGNIALRTGKKLDWDGPNLKITNVPEANAFLQREYREGWTA